MARVFLSYGHDDAAKARSIALALEKAGHSVWWDLHVRSGAQFSKVIEQALKGANVVVVLWSKHAVESAWVRDEAAVGRDTGRLVPVALDGSDPPLGFRQFQTIDFSRWKGRRGSRELQTLLADIASTAEGGPLPGESPAVASFPTTRIAAKGRLGIWLPVAAAMALAVAGASYWLLSRNAAEATTVAVIAKEPSSRAMAQDLLLGLGNLRSVQEGSVQLLGKEGEVRPKLVFETSSSPSDRKGETDLILMDGKDRTILWSRHFERGSGRAADLKQRMAFAAGRVLGCAVEALNPDEKPLRQQTLKLYLTGCSQLSEASSETIASVIPLLQQVVRDAPTFKPAWAKLLLAESDAVSASPTSVELRASLQQRIANARRLDPDMAEARLAQVTLLPPSAFGQILKLLDEAKATSPNNAVILAYRAQALARVGRMTDAVEDARQAARSDPAAPDAFSYYVLTLAYSGRVDAAKAELEHAERMWPGSDKLSELRHAFQLRFADPQTLLEMDDFDEISPTAQIYRRTRADPSPANIDRFMAILQELYSRRGLNTAVLVGHAQGYGELGREEELYELISRMPPREDYSLLADVLFRPSLRKFRHDPRFMGVAKRIGLVDYWKDSGKWPDFCFEPDQPYDCKAQAAKLASPV